MARIEKPKTLTVWPERPCCPAPSVPVPKNLCATLDFLKAAILFDAQSSFDFAAAVLEYHSATAILARDSLPRMLARTGWISTVRTYAGAIELALIDRD